jgi:hypothetical protein
MSNDERIRHLQQRIDHATSTASMRVIFQGFSEIEGEGYLSGALEHLREAAFETARRRSREDPTLARAIILESLLPLCLRTRSIIPMPERRNRYPKILSGWLDDLPPTERSAIRQDVIRATLPAFHTDEVRAASYLISEIGFRDPMLLDGLRRVIAAHDDETGDIVLAWRSGLGFTSGERDELASELVRRMRARWTSSLILAARDIPDRRVIDAVVDCWLTSKNLEDLQHVGTLEPQFSAQVIPAVADALWEDEEIQDVAWARMSYIDRVSTKFFRDWVYATSVALQRIDAPDVIRFLLKAYGEENSHQRFLVGLRIEECVRPRQTRGWEPNPPPETVRALREIACEASGMTGEFSTIEHRSKVQAWNMLLSLGKSELLPRFEEGIAGEDNGFVIAEVLDIAACFRNVPLPESVPALIATGYAGIQESENQRAAAHVAAVHVAHSAQTVEALRALLAFEPIRQGVLISVIEAIAETTWSLMRAGKFDAFASLLQIARTADAPYRRTAAAASLARLLRTGMNANIPVSVFIHIATDSSVDLYGRRELLESIGHLPSGSFSKNELSELAEIALGRSQATVAGGVKNEPNQLSDIALAVLARQGELTDNPDLLNQSLGIRRTTTGWEPLHDAPIGITKSHVLGILFSREPSEFASMVSKIILKESGLAVSQLEPFIKLVGDDTPQTVVEALLERAHRADRGRSAETDVLFLLAKVARRALLTDEWAHVENWLPQGREAMGDALASMGELDDELGSLQVKLLLKLAGDGQFAVRRAAYRALADVQPMFLANICTSWAVITNEEAIEIRKRAAEGSGWVREDLLSTEVQALAWDAEPHVRESYNRAMVDRRERDWAALYIEEVLAVKEPAGIITAWKYGKALVGVGDDRVIERLESHKRSTGLAPAIRHWLGRVAKDVRSRWEEVLRKWPEPWYTRRGDLETIEGTLKRGADVELALEGCLWYAPSRELGGISSWGGWTPSAVATGKYELVLPDGRTGSLYVDRSHHPTGPSFFVGTGPYPERVQIEHP